MKGSVYRSLQDDKVFWRGSILERSDRSPSFLVLQVTAGGAKGTHAHRRVGLKAAGEGMDILNEPL